MPVEKLKEEPTGDSVGESGGGGEGTEVGVAAEEKPASQLPPNRSSSSKLSLMSKRTSTKKKPDDPFRFSGDGVDFKAKLIGIQDVTEARGDEMCQEAMQMCKAIVKTSGQHKQRIILNISLKGLKIKDEKTGNDLYSFPVSKISFIARDVTDARAFGFVYGTPESKHKFYGIKTAQTADHSVLAIRDMFHIVYEMKKKQVDGLREREQSISEGKEVDNKDQNANDVKEQGGGVADLLNLEFELENIQQGMNQLNELGGNEWAAFDASKQMPQSSGSSASFADIFTSSTSNPKLNDTTTTSSSADPYGFQDSFNSGLQMTAPTPQHSTTNGNSLFDITPQHNGSSSQVQQGGNPFSSNIFTPTPPPPSAMSSISADPFDTSHVSSVIGHPASTPLHSNSAFVSPALDWSQPPSAISANSQSANVFDNTSATNGSNVLNMGMMESSGVGGGPPGLLDSFQPLRPEGSSDPAANNQPTQEAPISANNLDFAISKLGDLGSLLGGSNVAVTGVSLPATQNNPFDKVKRQEKPSINALRGTPTPPPGSGGKPAVPNLNELYSAQPPQPSIGGGGGAANPFLSGAPPAGPPPPTNHSPIPNPFGVPQQPQLPPMMSGIHPTPTQSYAAATPLLSPQGGFGGSMGTTPSLTNPPPPTTTARPRPKPGASGSQSPFDQKAFDPFADDFFK